jgi:hypothetical protein
MTARRRKQGVAAFGIAATGIMVWLLLAPPVLVSFHPDILAVRPRKYLIMNPLRDRRPEFAAGEVLCQLAARDLRVLGGIASEHIIEREKKFPVRSWRIGGRKDSAGTTSLMYWTRRGGGYGSEEEEVWLVVERAGAELRVTDFNAMY